MREGYSSSYQKNVVVVESLPIDVDELVEFARDIQALYSENDEEEFVVRLPGKATYHYSEDELRNII